MRGGGRRARWRSWVARASYVFSVAAGILPFSLNISHAAAAGTGRSAPVSGAAMDASEASRGSPLTPGLADVAAAGTAALRIIRCAQRTLNTYRASAHAPPARFSGRSERGSVTRSRSASDRALGTIQPRWKLATRSDGVIECWSAQSTNTPPLHHSVWDHADSKEMTNRRTRSGKTTVLSKPR